MLTIGAYFRSQRIAKCSIPDIRLVSGPQVVNRSAAGHGQREVAQMALVQEWFD